MNCLAENSDVKANSPWVFLFFIYSLFHTEFCRIDVRCNNTMCPVLHRNLTLNSERWIRPLLTSQDYKKLLLNVRSHSVTQYFPCCVSLPCFRRRLNMRSHCVTHCFPCCVSVPCSALPCPALRLPASQCAPGLTSKLQKLWHADRSSVAPSVQLTDQGC